MLAEWTEKQPIHCIGDSHASFFSGQDKIYPLWTDPSQDCLPMFRSYRLGPVLAYNLCKEGTTTQGRENLFTVLEQIKIHSKVMLCFGEIDCRAHLLKQSVLQNRSIEEVVHECVDRYFSVILEVADKQYDLLIWNVIPSSRYETVGNKDFPLYGTCRERNQVSKLFNQYLAELCVKKRIKFISIFDKLIDQDGLTRMEFYRDRVHLSQKAMPFVLEEMNRSLRTNSQISINFYIRKFLQSLQMKFKVK